MITCWIPLPGHTARLDEIMVVRGSDYYGAALVGAEGRDRPSAAQGMSARSRSDGGELTPRRKPVILPGQVIRYKGSFCFLQRFELPSETTVGLWHLVGFKVRLVSGAMTSVPSEDAGTNPRPGERRARAAMNFLVALRISRTPNASGQIACHRQRRSGGRMRVRELARVEVANQETRRRLRRKRGSHETASPWRPRRLSWASVKSPQAVER
jgi:hypothetical protein